MKSIGGSCQGPIGSPELSMNRRVLISIGQMQSIWMPLFYVNPTLRKKGQKNQVKSSIQNSHLRVAPAIPQSPRVAALSV
jgi:hypothetical protein